MTTQLPAAHQKTLAESLTMCISIATGSTSTSRNRASDQRGGESVMPAFDP